MPRDVYLQPNAPDPVLSPDVALAIARRHIPGASALASIDESGGEARTYSIQAGDEELILKVQRPQQLRPRTSLEKEVFFLRHLEQHAPELSVPRVRGYGRDSDLLEYTLMTRMPGVAMRHARLTDAQRQAMLRELGKTLRRIHTLPQEPFSASGLFPGDYAFPSVQTRFGEYFLDLAARAREQSVAWPLDIPIEEVGRRVLHSLPRTQERAALHSNPYTEHVFVHDANSPQSGSYAGLIDFGDAYVSHPAFDMRRWSHPAEREALLAGYTADGPVSDAFLGMWRAVAILGDVTTLVYYADQAERAAAAERDLARLLADL